MTLVTLLGAMALASTMAQAEAPSIEVSYADLDLASHAGRAALEARVARATRRVCGDTFALDLHTATASRKCIVAAHAKARLQIDLAVARTQNAIRVAAR